MVDVSKYPYGVERHPNVTMDLTDSFLNWTGIAPTEMLPRSW